MSEPHEIIHTASLTEKSTLMSEKQNKYVFRVSPKANKVQIKNAVERLFQKSVVDVNTEQLLAFQKILVTSKALEKLAERFNPPTQEASAR